MQTVPFERGWSKLNYELKKTDREGYAVVSKAAKSLRCSKGLMPLNENYVRQCVARSSFTWAAPNDMISSSFLA